MYDGKEDKLRKTLACGEKQVKDDEKGKALLDQFKEDDRDKRAYDKAKRREKMEEEKEYQDYIERKVKDYCDMKNHRKVLMRKEISGEEIRDEDREILKTWRTFLASMFREMEKKFRKLTKLSFPHMTYGTKQSSDTAKKAFPNSFKVYFFKLEKAF